MLSKETRIENLERALALYAEREKQKPDSKRRQVMTLCQKQLDKLKGAKPVERDRADELEDQATADRPETPEEEEQLIEPEPPKEE